MIVDEAGSLHVGVTSRGTHETEAALFHISAHCFGFGAYCRDFIVFGPDVLNGPAVYESPDVGIKAAELLLHLKKRLRVFDGCADFLLVSDDALIALEARNVIIAPGRDFLVIKIRESFSEPLAPIQHELPGKPRLERIQYDVLEMQAVIVHGHTPFFIVVADGVFFFGP